MILINRKRIKRKLSPRDKITGSKRIFFLIGRKYYLNIEEFGNLPDSWEFRDYILNWNSLICIGRMSGYAIECTYDMEYVIADTDQTRDNYDKETTYYIYRIIK